MVVLVSYPPPREGTGTLRGDQILPKFHTSEGRTHFVAKWPGGVALGDGCLLFFSSQPPSQSIWEISRGRFWKSPSSPEDSGIGGGLGDPKPRQGRGNGWAWGGGGGSPEQGHPPPVPSVSAVLSEGSSRPSAGSFASLPLVRLLRRARGQRAGASGGQRGPGDARPRRPAPSWRGAGESARTPRRRELLAVAAGPDRRGVGAGYQARGHAAAAGRGARPAPVTQAAAVPASHEGGWRPPGGGGRRGRSPGRGRGGRAVQPGLAGAPLLSPGTAAGAERVASGSAGEAWGRGVPAGSRSPRVQTSSPRDTEGQPRALGPGATLLGSSRSLAGEGGGAYRTSPLPRGHCRDRVLVEKGRRACVRGGLGTGRRAILSDCLGAPGCWGRGSASTSSSRPLPLDLPEGP